MTFKTNPEILKPINNYPLEVPIKTTTLFRQSYLIYTYVKSYLIKKKINIVQYTSQTNFNFCFIWLTYYKSNFLIKDSKKKLVRFNTNFKNLKNKFQKKTYTTKDYLIKYVKPNLYSNLKKKYMVSKYFNTITQNKRINNKILNLSFILKKNHQILKKKYKVF